MHTEGHLAAPGSFIVEPCNTSHQQPALHEIPGAALRSSYLLSSSTVNCKPLDCSIHEHVPNVIRVTLGLD